MNIGPIDWIIVVVYLVGVVGLGCWAGIVARRKGKTKGESEAGDYFMAAHTLKWPVIGLALFATNISCVHLVSLAQSGYDTGLLNGNFEWMAAFTLILLGFFFAPFYLKSKVATLPDFLEKRYCRECRDWLAVVSIVAAIIFHIAFPLATGWLILHDIFGIEKWTCIVVMCVLTGIYTVTGGLAAVAITETIQTIILLLGAFVITWFAWEKTGGWGGMTAALDSTPGSSDSQLMSMLRPHGDPSGMPWYAVFLGYPVLGIWYWCADQTIVQRVLGARSENDARVGSIFCGLIKILPVFIFIVPGLMLYTAVKQGRVDGVSQVRVVGTATAPDGTKEHTIALTGATGAGETIIVKQGDQLDLSQYPAAASGKEPAIIIGPGVPVKGDGNGSMLTPPGVKAYQSKEVYAVMIRKLLPSGVLGVLAAALMAALMGNLSSASNSIATMVSYDIVKRFRPHTGDKQLVRIGRIATLVAISSGIALVPLLDRYESIFSGINDIIAHMAPPITSVFVLGVFWPAASARGAKWTMWLGSLLGVMAFTLKTLHVWKPADFAWVPAFLYETPFMMMAFYMCVACIAMQVVFTLLMPKEAGEDPQSLYWRYPLEALEFPGWRGLGNYKVLAAIVILAMTSLYAIFR
ncbi:sodium/solute symporter [Luteolibacter arcticus]|uniref:Sodium/solute symporter n=1 Tax=Luteolibacter arcticus TaxID=1581411 RepID=A0ABT3GK60_9BACT|nr:sodium/solute symporter [Luteolibacter arcticus]MCW1923856.1 sodium/solute symporter [Luteolibacter arcticus]